MSIREGKYDAIQTALLYLRGGIAQILGIGSQLRYTSVPALTNVLDIPHKGFFSGNTVVFTTASTWPFAISGFSTIYAEYGSVPTMIVRELTASGVHRTRTDIQPVYDSNTDILTIDVVAFNGDITFKP